jgi:hypothetical protein
MNTKLPAAVAAVGLLGSAEPRFPEALVGKWCQDGRAGAEMIVFTPTKLEGMSTCANKGCPGHTAHFLVAGTNLANTIHRSRQWENGRVVCEVPMKTKSVTDKGQYHGPVTSAHETTSLLCKPFVGLPADRTIVPVLLVCAARQPDRSRHVVQGLLLANFTWRSQSSTRWRPPAHPGAVARSKRSGLNVLD